MRKRLLKLTKAFKFWFKKIKKLKLPISSWILIFLLFLPLSYLFYKNKIIKTPQIMVEQPASYFPSNLTLSNLTSGQFNISFMTIAMVNSAIFWGDKPDQLTNKVINYYEKPSTFHYLTIPNLNPATKYYFKICSQSQPCDNLNNNSYGSLNQPDEITSGNCKQNGNIFLVQTLPTSTQLKAKELNLIYGQAEFEQGVKGGLLQIQLTKDKVISYLVSIPIRSDNRWALDLTNLIDKTTNLYITDFKNVNLTFWGVSNTNQPVKVQLINFTSQNQPINLNFNPPPPSLAVPSITPSTAPSMLPILPSLEPAPSSTGSAVKPSSLIPAPTSIGKP